MKIKHLVCTLLLSLLSVGCATVNIPPELSTWAETVRQQIGRASETNYVYIPVTDKLQRDIVEDLAFKQGKQTQRIKKDGQMIECVFVFSRF